MVASRLIGKSGQAGLDARRRRSQELIRMAVATFNTVSGGSEGWAGGITTALYKELNGKRVRGAGSSRRRWEIKWGSPATISAT